MIPDTHDAIVNDWKTNAQDHDDENYDFLRSLKWQSGKKVDRIARELHQEVFQIIDCTRCANCCRHLRPEFTDEDIDRIANHLGQTRDEFITNFLEWDDEQQQYRTKSAPCPLLSDDGKCTVYDVRPETCRGYPYTDKEGFVFHAISRANSALVCPAAFAIVEGMKERFVRR
jgi:Fe-S-cluster containining protein